MHKLKIVLVFKPKTYLDLLLLCIWSFSQPLILSIFFGLFIDKHHLFKLHLLLVKVMSRKTLVCLQFHQPFLSGYVIIF